MVGLAKPPLFLPWTLMYLETMVRPLLPVILAAVAFAQPPQQFADLGDFKLASGEVIRNCRLGYRTYGRMNEARSNVILSPTWFSGRTSDLDTWIGAGKLADSSKFFVIAVDALANGVSSSPSNGQSPFPQITIRDMASSERLLLEKHLGIRHVRAVMGISMGGMQTFEWMVAYPDFMDRAVPIVGSPRLASPDLLLWQAELNAIEAAEKCSCDLRAAMKTVAAIHQFAIATPEWRSQNTPASDFQKFRAEIESEATTRMDPRDWAAQLRAMLAHDVSRAFGGSLDRAAKEVRARTLVVVATQDHMVNPGSALEFSKQAGASTVLLTGNCGHRAISCETARLVAAVQDFLSP